MQNNQLDALRNEIDALDSKIVEFLSKRLSLVQSVAQTKLKMGMEVKDQKREQEILEKITCCHSAGVREIYQKIFEISSKLQVDFQMHSEK
jgi:chorismate mutase